MSFIVRYCSSNRMGFVGRGMFAGARVDLLVTSVAGEDDASVREFPSRKVAEDWVRTHLPETQIVTHMMAMSTKTRTALIEELP